MTRCATIVLYSAVVGLFLSTICLGQAPTSGPQTVFGLFNDLQIAKINELIDTKLKTLSTSQTAAVNDLIDTKLTTLSVSQTAAVNELIDTKLKTSSASQTAAVNDLIDTKLKTLSASQTAKLNELMTKIVNDTQAAKLNEMIDIKLKTWSDSQTERINLIDTKLNNSSVAQTEKINEQKTILAILSAINTKIDNIRRPQSWEQRGYVVEQEDECARCGGLRRNPCAKTFRGHVSYGAGSNGAPMPDTTADAAEEFSSVRREKLILLPPLRSQR